MNQKLSKLMNLGSNGLCMQKMADEKITGERDKR